MVADWAQLTIIRKGEEKEHQLPYPRTYTAYSFQQIGTVVPCAQSCWMDVFVQPCDYENHWCGNRFLSGFKLGGTLGQDMVAFN